MHVSGFSVQMFKFAVLQRFRIKNKYKEISSLLILFIVPAHDLNYGLFLLIYLHVLFTWVVTEVWYKYNVNSFISWLRKPLLCSVLVFTHLCFFCFVFLCFLFWHITVNLKCCPSLNTILEKDSHLQLINKKIEVGHNFTQFFFVLYLQLLLISLCCFFIYFPFRILSI